jgi:hypothetical protein
MNKIPALLALICLGYHAQAQESTFNQSDLVFNAGIGIGTNLYTGSAYSSFLPPISISGEYALLENFITDGLTLGVGGYIGFAGAEYRVRVGNEEWGWRYNYTVMGARAAVHYPFLDKLDTYGGLMLSYNALNTREIGNVPGNINPEGGNLGISLYIGGRYYFEENFAAMAEIGYGVSNINIGVALKF